jgi:hypothetical protein
MTLPKNVAELQGENVVFELECIDRMYLNAYVPKLTSEKAIAGYFRGFLGHRFASTKSAASKSEALVREIMKFVRREKIALVRFEKGVRKDEVMKKMLRNFRGQEAVLFVGVAQEKARVPRTIRKRFGEGGSIPLQPEGVRNRQLRPLLAQCLGIAENQITQGKMSYDLRRLRLPGIIDRIEGTHRYRLSAAGMKTAFLYSRLYLRALRPALSTLHAQNQTPHPIQQTFRKLQRQIDNYYADKVAA